MRRYETSIKLLMQGKKEYYQKNGHQPIFLSDWDADYSSITFPKINYNLKNTDAQKYYFWTDENNFRIEYKHFFKKNFGENIDIDTFTFGTNGSSCLALSLLALKEMNIKNTMVITPIYFSILNLLDEFEFDVSEYSLNLENSFDFNLKLFEEQITKNSSELVILTNPIFGTGIEISPYIIEKISYICNKHDTWFLMDYIYGGMPWNIDKKQNYLFNYQMYSSIIKNPKHIFIESISKRIFLNGVKIALIFSNKNLIRRIMRLSIFMVGSMCATQLNTAKKIYSSDSESSLIAHIGENAKIAQQNFEKINNILYYSNCSLTKSKSGYFTLLSIPKEKINDLEYALIILEKTGVLTTPHSRYLLKENNSTYSFRVNLLINETDLINGVIRIKNLK